MNESLLVSIHCYAGDRHQVEELMPFYEHHQAPIVVVSPSDSQVHNMGAHICRAAGRVGYIGQHTWDRQHLQLKLLLDYPQKWFLLNDSDSFCILPKLPDYVFKEDTVFSNEVDDFRIPGQSWKGGPPWPLDFHKGYPLIAMQPPYFMSRSSLERVVKASEGLVACPTCPFIDWAMVVYTINAGLKNERYKYCASCENSTEHGKAVMRECVRDRKAQFIHSVKSGKIARELVTLYHNVHGS
jgi:hypothetical protein